jgi:predicted GH43/DUF377 family glycosyl hydrolase
MPEFSWKKLGKIFSPDGRHEWMQDYAQNPSVLILPDRLRAYFTCRPKRDARGFFTSVTAFVDLDRKDPTKVIAIPDQPILELGKPGSFDQFGVMPGNAIRVGNQVWLYYVGWTRCEGVPYNHAIGLAISDDNGSTFKRFADGPLLTRTHMEPYIQNSPYCMIDNNVFHMWYSSGIQWLENEGKMESIYVLMHATSSDGVSWLREGLPFMSYRVESECQTNPTVIKIDERYHMWFCYRCGVDFRNASRGYRIGYAWSDDLKLWNRDDSIGVLEPSTQGWDSQMVCYPRVEMIDKKLYMFYSGNYFGRDGFGAAISESAGNLE